MAKRKKKSSSPAPTTAPVSASSAMTTREWLRQPIARMELQAKCWAAVFVSALALYCLTMPSYVSMEDAGEFIASAYKLGIPHPPGYPLYVWIGHLFTYLPFGTVASRVHMFSAVSGAAAAGLLTLIAFRLRTSAWAAVLAGLGFALSRTLWSQSVIAEVYALNAFFLFLLLWIALRLHERFDRRLFWLFGFVYGLSLTNHWPLIGLASGAFAILLLPHWKQTLKALPIGLLIGVLGLTPYLLLFFARPEITFLGPLRSFQDLVAYVLRKEYAADAVQATATARDGFLFAFDFFKRTALEMGPLFAPLIGIGAWRSFIMYGRWIGLALVASFVSSSIILLFFLRLEFNMLTQVVFAVFHLVPFGVAALWSGFALDWMREHPALGPKRARVWITVIASALILQALAWNWKTNNLRDDDFPFQFAKLALESLPERAVFLSWADPDVGPFVYAWVAEKIRPDVILSTQTGVILPVKIYDRRDVRSDKARAARTVDAIRQWFREGRRVFSIRRLYYFNTMPELLPFQYVNHGLYEEIVEALPAVPPDNRIWAEKAVPILDQFAAGDYGPQWGYHRDFLVNRLCRLLVKNGIPHPLFEKHRDCILMRLEKVRDQDRDFAAADQLLEKVLHLSKSLPLQDQIESARHFFINRVQLTSQSSLDGNEKMRRFQQAVDLVEPMALKVPGCANLLALSILETRKQIALRVDLENMTRMFSKCPKHKEFLAAIRKSK
ncbi:MAG: DUF2723 domain-containing protein [Bdellovibrionaceae bacterium]|nr:DUF2723 domain-containing protein [Pseudobdellovibrionaceae bacterium]